MTCTKGCLHASRLFQLCIEQSTIEIAELKSVPFVAAAFLQYISADVPSYKRGHVRRRHGRLERADSGKS